MHDGGGRPRGRGVLIGGSGQSSPMGAPKEISVNELPISIAVNAVQIEYLCCNLN